jgi:lipoprotein-anchoring transpeptidase ErfK/SrfK
MITSSKILAFTSVSFKTGVSSLVVLGLVGCDGLARFNTKKDAPPTEPVVAEESVETAAPASAPSAAAEPEKDKKLASPLYEWKGDGRSITRIVVNTNEQKARFYSGNEEIGWSTVATGLSKYPTPTGRFQVTEKVENKRSNLYGKVYGKGGRVLRSSVKVGRDRIPDGGRFEGAHMPFFMRLTDDGIGLHAGPIPNPGQPASHGCIRMPSKIAPLVFRQVSHGTAVTIEGKGPNYGDYVARQRAETARRAEARRIAEEKRAAEAKKAQQVAQAAPSAADTATKPQEAAGTETRETHAVAKDEATPATQAIDTTNARETRMREPVRPDAPGSDADRPATPPESASVQPSEQTNAPAPEAANPVSAEATPAERQPSIIEDAAPAAGEGAKANEANPAPVSTVTPESAPKTEPQVPSAPTRPAPEIREAPAPAPQPAAPTAETITPAPQPAPAPAPKPAEPAPSPAPAANPQPSAAPAAAPADSAAE